MKKISPALIILCILIPRLDALGGGGEAVKISFIGDIMMHNAVKQCALANNRLKKNSSMNNGGFDYLFERIRPCFESSDMVIGNMEFPVAAPFVGKRLIFNCFPEVMPAMKKMGINLLTIANNHILDQGASGLVETMRYLRNYGIDYIGVKGTETAARSGIIVQMNGIRIGFIAYTGVSNYGFPLNPRGYFINNLYDKEVVLEDIRAIRGWVDYLVMIVHRGMEYKYFPQKIDTILLREYLEEGVDLVVGHHPHVLQYVEKVSTRDGRETFIFYSLGNFISNQTFSYELPDGGRYTTRESIILNLYLSRPVKQILQRFEIVPIWTVNERAVREGRQFKNIQTVALPDRIRELIGELVIGGQREEILREIRYLNSRMAVMKRILFLRDSFEEIQVITEPVR